MKPGTGLQAHVRKTLQLTGKIAKSEMLFWAQVIIYDGLAIRLSKARNPRTTNSGRTKAVRNISSVFASKKIQAKWAQKLGVKSDGRGGLVCENWQNPANLGTAEGIISVPESDIRGEVPSQGDASSASLELHPSGKRKRGRPCGVVQLPPSASACDTTKLT
jgi:hypothetical protein